MGLLHKCAMRHIVQTQHFIKIRFTADPELVLGAMGMRQEDTHEGHSPMHAHSDDSVY